MSVEFCGEIQNVKRNMCDVAKAACKYVKSCIIFYLTVCRHCGPG
jgi:hypothetical protein